MAGAQLADSRGVGEVVVRAFSHANLVDGIKCESLAADALGVAVAGLERFLACIAKQRVSVAVAAEINALFAHIVVERVSADAARARGRGSEAGGAKALAFETLEESGILIVAGVAIKHASCILQVVAIGSVAADALSYAIPVAGYALRVACIDAKSRFKNNFIVRNSLYRHNYWLSPCPNSHAQHLAQPGEWVTAAGSGPAQKQHRRGAYPRRRKGGRLALTCFTFVGGCISVLADAAVGRASGAVEVTDLALADLLLCDQHVVVGIAGRALREAQAAQALYRAACAGIVRAIAKVRVRAVRIAVVVVEVG